MIHIRALFIALSLSGILRAQPVDTAPPRYISPLDCLIEGKVDGKNIVSSSDVKFKVSQKGADAYNQFSISRDTEISGTKVGSFVFRSIPTESGIDNAAYSKKMHFDLYDYGNLNGNKDRELIKAGDEIFVTFLVRFATTAPVPIAGSKFDNDDPRYRRTLFFQFWPGGVAMHFNSYRADESKGRFGYVTVLTADYGENKSKLSEQFEVRKDAWYRVYFRYKPDVSDGRILAKIEEHTQGMETHSMRTLTDLKGNTLYIDKSHRRILPTFGHYHWGGCPNIVETHFTEMRLSRQPIESHTLVPAQPTGND